METKEPTITFGDAVESDTIVHLLEPAILGGWTVTIRAINLAIDGHLRHADRGTLSIEPLEQTLTTTGMLTFGWEDIASIEIH